MPSSNGKLDCRLNFSSSDELIKYVESTGAKPIPVTFRVYYEKDGRPSGAILVRVGERDGGWREHDEGTISVGGTIQKLEPGETKSVNFRGPADCFDLRWR
jgi:hypothetical protein